MLLVGVRLPGYSCLFTILQHRISFSVLNEYFENVAKLKNLGTMVTDRSYIREESRAD